jgi:negative regulator of sigma E activity
MLGYIVGLIGCWIFSDGLYSIALYLHAPSFREGEKQSWKKDHAIRLVRVLAGIALMVLGGVIMRV